MFSKFDTINKQTKIEFIVSYINFTIDAIT